MLRFGTAEEQLGQAGDSVNTMLCHTLNSETTGNRNDLRRPLPPFGGTGLRLNTPAATPGAEVTLTRICSFSRPLKRHFPRSLSRTLVLAPCSGCQKQQTCPPGRDDAGRAGMETGSPTCPVSRCCKAPGDTRMDPVTHRHQPRALAAQRALQLGSIPLRLLAPRHDEDRASCTSHEPLSVFGQGPFVFQLSLHRGVSNCWTSLCASP